MAVFWNVHHSGVERFPWDIAMVSRIRRNIPWEATTGSSENSCDTDECPALSTNGIGFMNVREWGAKGVVEGVTELCGLGIAVSLYFYF